MQIFAPSDSPECFSVAFSPDGKWLAAGQDQALFVWEAASVRGPPLKEFRRLSTPGHFVQFAPDSRTVTACRHGHQDGSAHELYRWDVTTGEKQPTIPMPSRGDWLAFHLSADGKTLAVAGSSDTLVRLFDAATGRPRFPEEGHTQGVLDVAFSPDGGMLASGAADGLIKLWNLASDKEVRTLTGHTGPVRSVTFSPDGRVLASGGFDNAIRLWDAASGAPLHVLAGHTAGVEQVAFRPDGRSLASAGWDHTARLWDLSGGARGQVFNAADAVWGVAFHPDGRTLVAVSKDRTVAFYDVESGRRIQIVLDPQPVGAAVFFPDGKTLATTVSSDGLVRLREPATGDVRRTLGGGPEALGGVAVRPDGRMVATSGYDGAVQLWGLASEPPRRKAFFVAPDHCWIGKVAFSPEGRYLAVGHPGGAVYLFRLAHRGTVAEFSAHNLSWVEERRLEGHGHSLVHTVAVVSDGREALTCEGSDSDEHTIRRWDLSSGGQLAVYQAPPFSIWKCGFAADGRRMVAGGKDERVRLWNFVDQRAEWVKEGHYNWVTSAAVSPDGKLALSGSKDQTARLWDGRTGDPGKVLAGGHTGPIRSVCLSEDGRLALTAGDDCRVCLWDARTGQRLLLFQGSQSDSSPVCFTPDGRRAAWVGDNGLVRVWDTDELHELLRLPCGDGQVRAVAFSPDGKRLLVGGANGLLTLWDATTGRVVDRTRSTGVLSAAFTPDGRRAVTGHNDGVVRVWLLPEPDDNR